MNKNKCMNEWKCMTGSQRERDRQADRETDIQLDRQTKRPGVGARRAQGAKPPTNTIHIFWYRNNIQ